jgi:hypothetical protein
MELLVPLYVCQPYQGEDLTLEKIILLKEILNIDPSDFLELDGALTERQRSIIDLIMEKGSFKV